MSEPIVIAYCGLKNDGETAFFHETGGITWFPGDVHAIEASLAKRLLQHPDVFERADAPPEPPQAQPDVQSPVHADGDTVTETATAADAQLADALAPGATVAAKPRSSKKR